VAVPFPADQLQAVHHQGGCDDSPQLELEFREITEDREEKVRIIEVGSLDHQIIGKLVEAKICTFKLSKCVF
jgi:hypothetical protein